MAALADWRVGLGGYALLHLGAGLALLILAGLSLYAERSPRPGRAQDTPPDPSVGVRR